MFWVKQSKKLSSTIVASWIWPNKVLSERLELFAMSSPNSVSLNAVNVALGSIGICQSVKLLLSITGASEVVVETPRCLMLPGRPPFAFRNLVRIQ